MPRDKTIKKVMLIGSGPIIIGQACEFDYSGTQACKALKEEGIEVVLVNSNPATIMTDPEIADATYIEPLQRDILELIIKKEKPDSLLPTMGGQTALNLAVQLAESGILEQQGVRLIGANLNAIKKAEDRQLFKSAMTSIGLKVPISEAVNTIDEGLKAVEKTGFPAILRPAFTLGGTGGGIAYNIEEYKMMLERALKLSPVSQVLIEQSVLGWKEFELEVVRDRKDNVVIICSIENLDPMGIHTGDSITVAPAQTLTDKEYQVMRDAAIAVIREIGVDTGGSNIQFAINPSNGDMVVIEMNPRVSRSSALASKATGFPIAKIAAKLAIGYTLDELTNDITKETPASFEPTIDYVVTKIPRFTFEKFPTADPVLMTQMKSVGEIMSIGRTFKESLQKGLRSLETGLYGLEPVEASKDEVRARLKTPNADRLLYIAQAFRQGMSVDDIYELTMIDRWFLNNIKEIVDTEKELTSLKGLELSDDLSQVIYDAKMMGFSDRLLGNLLGKAEKEIREFRYRNDIIPVYKLVDTCAGEFEAYTPYLYSSYERPFFSLADSDNAKITKTVECEARPSNRQKVVILGSGPNRIGQGIEFDYCCVHAVYALKELGYETIMVNCNPETVSTDYDTSDKLFFEPLTLEDVLHIIKKENPIGVIVQFGGQTPLKLAVPLEKEGVNILGTKSDSIDRAEDRKRFKELLDKLSLKQPQSETVMSVSEAITVANTIGYPVLVRPSYVLGGRAMEIVYDEKSLIEYMEKAVKVSPEHPILIDKYLEDAIEVDVDAISDGEIAVIGSVMEHIEEAGIHSGDSACSIPPYSLPQSIISEIKEEAKRIALELKVVGLMNAQFAVKDDTIYVLEVNPRASRTIPYVSKTIGVPLAKIAAKLIAGKTLKELNITKDFEIRHVSVKEAVFPFDKFPGVDTILGPEMKSTGEVMGIDEDFGLAYAKAQSASNNRLPIGGKCFISVKDKDKPATVEIAKRLIALGFSLVATRGTASYLRNHGIKVEAINKVNEGRPHCVDMIKNRELSYIINTVTGAQAQRDSLSIRRSALQFGISYSTTIAGAKAAVTAMEMVKTKQMTIKSIQEYHRH
ncbi:MAG: carbamoyl-phosphate synthase large subunit [Thermodesulfovibrionales bacterium]|nr:carbamoyl-phosphate synthase large subunit [Thermodesulfovibrionales bacterium]